MWFNSENTTTERCKVKYTIYMYNKRRTFSNVEVMLSNFAMTIEFFHNQCVIFL